MVSSLLHQFMDLVISLPSLMITPTTAISFQYVNDLST
jgi:hypothetical protein